MAHLWIFTPSRTKLLTAITSPFCRIGKNCVLSKVKHNFCRFLVHLYSDRRFTQTTIFAADPAFLDVAKGIRKTVAFLSAIPVQPFNQWDVIAAALPDEREQRLAYLLYYCGLKPREIARLLPEEFKNIQEVFQLNRSILQRLRRTKDEIRWFLNSDGQGD